MLQSGASANRPLPPAVLSSVYHGDFLSFRYECPWLEFLQCGHLPPLPAHRHCNTNIQVNVVTHWKALLCFSTFLLVFLSLICERISFFSLSLIFGGDHILLCSVSLRVWGSTRVERAVRHLINSERLSLFPSVLFLFFFFNVGLFWHFCRVGNNAPFQLFFFLFRMIQMPYFHSCAKVVSAFLLLMLR